MFYSSGCMFQLKAVADMNQRDLQSKMEQEEKRVSFYSITVWILIYFQE